MHAAAPRPTRAIARGEVMGELIGRTFAIALFASLCFCIGWLVGADDVLAQCRANGITIFLGEQLSCTGVKPWAK